jgi:dienelactone hydrolase
MSDQYTTLAVAGIETHLFGPPAAGWPVVFVTHGRGGHVEHVFPWCRELAAMGMLAVAVEQRNHGKRIADAAQNGGWGPTHAADLYGNMVGTARDISLLIDLLPARAGIRMKRVAMTGGSMGGHVTLLAMAADPRIGVGAPLIGGGDYRQLMAQRARTNGVPDADVAQFFPPALETVVQRCDPITNAGRFADRPLLLINGDADSLVPVECNKEFYAACSPHYRHPERLRLSIYAGVGHQIVPEMWAEAKAWMAQWV